MRSEGPTRAIGVGTGLIEVLTKDSILPTGGEIALVFERFKLRTIRKTSIVSFATFFTNSALSKSSLYFCNGSWRRTVSILRNFRVPNLRTFGSGISSIVSAFVSTFGSGISSIISAFVSRFVSRFSIGGDWYSGMLFKIWSLSFDVGICVKIIAD